VYQPHLVKKAIAPTGEEMVVSPKVSFRLPFSQQTLAVLDEGLRLVVEGEHGTAKSLRNKYYSVGGKTGTAENPHGENHSWFVGFAPLENPEIVVCAIVENAGHGSEVAAPLVGTVIRSYMEKHGYVKEIAAQDGSALQ
jgi:penicillin-binding protein 2